MPRFIENTKKKAQEYKVETLCEFMVGYINQSVKVEKDYDIVILGTVGEVLGNQEETLNKLSSTLKKDGYVLLDDALLVDESEFSGVLNEQIMCLTKRINELKEKYPSQTHLFDEYLKSQLAECDELENDVIGATMLLKKI